MQKIINFWTKTRSYSIHNLNKNYFSEDDQKSLIMSAMDQFTQYTCIRFRERTSSDTDYVRIYKGIGY
jgi:hypothetical protein